MEQSHPKERMSMFTEIESSINEYLDANLQSIIGDTSEPLKYPVDETYHDFILQDIKKQLTNQNRVLFKSTFRRWTYERNNKKNGSLNN